MTVRIGSRAGLCAVLLALTAQPSIAPAQTIPALKTRNVVLIVSDGLRWQEVFTGADPQLLNEANGGIWDKEEDLRREFWRDSPEFVHSPAHVQGATGISATGGPPL